MGKTKSVFIAGLLLWGLYTYPTAAQIFRYFTYTSSQPIAKIEWEAKAVYEDLWKPYARFEYVVNGTTYRQEEIFQGGRYRNSFAAGEAIKELAKEKSQVWFSSRNPQKGTIEKFFPLKNLVYSIILLSLFFYVVWRWNR